MPFASGVAFTSAGNFSGAAGATSLVSRSVVDSAKLAASAAAPSNRSGLTSAGHSPFGDGGGGGSSSGDRAAAPPPLFKPAPAKTAPSQTMIIAGGAVAILLVGVLAYTIKKRSKKKR